MIISLSVNQGYKWRWTPHVWTHYSLPGVWAAWGSVQVHAEVQHE
jgi:hypothetical protein